VTDDAGRFRFTRLPAGRYSISARKAGYPQMNYGARRANRTGSGVVIADGQALTDVTVTLARGAVIEGTVYDEQGTPMPGVPLNAWEVRTALSGDRTLTFPRAGGDVTTDDRGMYRIYNLPPGEYTIGTAWYFSSTIVRVPTDDEIRAAFAVSTAAAAPGTTSARVAAPSTPLSYSPIYHPDLVDPMSARTFTLAAGEERTGVDVRMRMVPMSYVEATVTDQDGSTPQNIEIQLSRRSPIAALNSATVTFGAGGRYRSEPLPPGDYGFVVTAAATPNQPARTAAMPLTISGAEPIKLSITLQSQPPVAGQLIFEGSTAPPDKTRISVGLGYAPNSFGNRNSIRSTVSADGVLKIDNVSPGRYILYSTVPGQPSTGPTGWTLLSAQADGRDVTDQVFEIGSGAPPSLTLTYTDKIGELSGRLVQPSGKPGTDYFVVIVPKEREYWLPGSRRIVSTRPDLDGRYVLRGLPAGNYQIAVTTEFDTDDLREMSALEKLVAASVPVTLGAGEQKTFDIRVGGG